MLNKKLAAEVSLLFVAFIWGATFVIVQNAIDILPPLLFNAIRFFIAGIIIFLFYLIKNRGKITIKWFSLFPGLILGSCLFIGYSLQTIGLLYTTPSKAGFITGLSVVMVPILAFIFLKIRPQVSAILGSIAAAFGLYLLAVKNSSPFSIGDFYVFLCTFGFAFHIILTDRFAKRVPVLLLTTIQILTVAVLCMFSSLFFEDWKIVLDVKTFFSPSLLFAILITSLLGTAAAFFIQTFSQKDTSPTRVAIILAMEPVFAAITSYFWINERLTAAASIGCLLILFGMIIAEIPIGNKRLFTLKRKIS
ncbi:DMT family transporter [Heyndrickxia sp. NPDC080065]|uniref:DMT family transporter n=1 Tax=Heyndrickxia sp. NPDC080065 TaxID=3390568 RepID=UPI003CFD1CCB